MIDDEERAQQVAQILLEHARHRLSGRELEVCELVAGGDFAFTPDGMCTEECPHCGQDYDVEIEDPEEGLDYADRRIAILRRLETGHYSLICEVIDGKAA